MTNITRLVWIVGIALSVPATTRNAGAQFPRPAPDVPENRLEFDGFVGLTAVDVENWARVARVDDSNRLAYGLAARFILTRIGRARVGVEVGTQQHFTYRLFTQAGSQTITEHYTVASQHVTAFARFAPVPQLMYDFGFGFHYFEDYSRPGVHMGFRYLLFEGRNWSVPIGGRAHSVLDDFASLTGFNAQAGLALRR